MAYKLVPIAPLSGSFMIASILGFIISATWIYDLPYTWAPKIGFAFSVVFTLMFIASVISMTKAPVEEELELDLRKKRKI